MRVAGNVPDPVVLGSMEYDVEHPCCVAYFLDSLNISSNVNHQKMAELYFRIWYKYGYPVYLLNELELKNAGTRKQKR